MVSTIPSWILFFEIFANDKRVDFKLMKQNNIVDDSSFETNPGNFSLNNCQDISAKRGSRSYVLLRRASLYCSTTRNICPIKPSSLLALAYNCEKMIQGKRKGRWMEREREGGRKG